MTDRPRYPKSSCCVIGCRRTSTVMPGEWICGEHWRMVDKRLKAFYRKQMRKLGAAWEKAKAAENAAEARMQANMPDAVRVLTADLDVYVQAASVRRGARKRYWRAEDLIWGRIKRQATERALGISA